MVGVIAKKCLYFSYCMANLVRRYNRHRACTVIPTAITIFTIAWAKSLSVALLFLSVPLRKSKIGVMGFIIYLVAKTDDQTPSMILCPVPVSVTA